MPDGHFFVETGYYYRNPKVLVHFPASSVITGGIGQSRLRNLSPIDFDPLSEGMAHELESEVHQTPEVASVDGSDLPDGYKEHHVDRRKDSEIQEQLYRNQVPDFIQGTHPGKSLVKEGYGKKGKEAGSDRFHMKLTNDAADGRPKIVPMECDKKINGGNHECERRPGGHSGCPKVLNEEYAKRGRQDHEQDRAAHVEFGSPHTSAGLTGSTHQHVCTVTDDENLNQDNGLLHSRTQPQAQDRVRFEDNKRHKTYGHQRNVL